MFQITMQTESDTFKAELYDVIHDVMNAVVAEKRRENELPPMISKQQMADHIFGVSPQTLDSHVIHRPDFPKLKVGERILFPRDQVLEWIRKNSTPAKVATNVKFGSFKTIKEA